LYGLNFAVRLPPLLTKDRSVSYGSALEANRFKFTPSSTIGNSLRQRLLSTGERELIDASPYDRIWGIGFKAADAKKKSVNRDQWGENKFGKALMEIRTNIRSNWDPTSVFDTPGSGFFVEW
jgi:ribA/ribD-fused uncharacterized protein